MNYCQRLFINLTRSNKCWGLGNPQTTQKLGDLIWTQDLAVVFLAETWPDEQG